MRFINRQLPIAEVAGALDLRFDGAKKIHCWHPERHKNGDSNASVGIRTSNNTVKCFGCDSRPMGPIDLTMDVRGLASGADAALWIAGKFNVPMIPAGKRLQEPERSRFRFGYESGLDLLIRSGLWSTLSAPAQSIAAVFSSMSDKGEPTAQEATIRLSYAGIKRYCGVTSPNAIRRGLLELGEIGFLRLPEAGLHRSPLRGAATYIVTPNSEELMELAHAFASQMRTEIEAERELRARRRKEKAREWIQKSSQ
jgi:hypothetical protein